MYGRRKVLSKALFASLSALAVLAIYSLCDLNGIWPLQIGHSHSHIRVWGLDGIYGTSQQEIQFIPQVFFMNTFLMYFLLLRWLKKERRTIKMVDMYTKHTKVLPVCKTLNPYGCMHFCC